MNLDSTPPVPPAIPPEGDGDWESRLTARLLGELSQEQSKALDEAITRDPELARLEQRLRRTLGFVREAVAEPAEPAVGSKALPRMSPGKRERLLANLRAGAGVGSRTADGAARETSGAVTSSTKPSKPTTGEGGSADKIRGTVIPVEFVSDTPARFPKVGARWLALAACLVALLLAGAYVVNSVGKPRAERQFALGTVETEGTFRFLKRSAPEALARSSSASSGPQDRGPSGPVTALAEVVDELSVANSTAGGNGAVVVYDMQQPAIPGAVAGKPPLPISRFTPVRGVAAPGAPLGSPLTRVEADPMAEVPALRKEADSRGDSLAFKNSALPHGGVSGGSGGGGGRGFGGGAGSVKLEQASQMETLAVPPVDGGVEAEPDRRSGGARGRNPTVFSRSVARASPVQPPSAAEPAAAPGSAAVGFTLDAATGAIVRSEPSPARKSDASTTTGRERVGRLQANVAPPPPTPSPAAAVNESESRFGRNEPGLAIPGAAGRAFYALAPDSNGRSGDPSERKDLADRPESRTERELLEKAREQEVGLAKGTPVTPLTPSLLNRNGLVNGPVLGDAPTVGEAFRFFKQNVGEVEAKPSAALGQEMAGVKLQFGSMLNLDSGAAAVTNQLQEAVEDKQTLLRRELVAWSPASPVPQPEVEAAFNNVSTFSLNVSDVSFKLAGASLENGQLPDPATVRTEEFLNSFQYRDPEPLPGRPVAFAWERAQFPFAQQRDVLRFAVRTGATGREAGRPMNLVLVLDSSGSMERSDRVATIQEALKILGNQLKPEDRVSVVTFARTARLWIDGLPGNQASELAGRVGELTPEGGTHLEDALRVGYETALKHFAPEGINRLVLMTDGAANLGELRADALRQMVEANRKRGVALDCFGIGFDGYQDELLEALSRNGDGRYGFVNSPEEAATGFVNQLAGALQVAASDVKVQVEFNPERVKVWRQIGYARHQLTQEQFRDNTVDAAELGAAEAGNALYVIETNERGNGPIGAVRARYRDPVSGAYAEHEWAVPYDGPAIPLEQASPALRLATAASAFGELLSASPYASEVTNDRLLTLLNGVPDAFRPDPRPEQLHQMVQQAQSILGR